MKVADVILRRSPLQIASRWRSAGRLAVLGFHGVDEPDHFAALMDHLLRIRYRPISADELTAVLEGRATLPERAVLVTFDDGERSVLEFGLPILAERGIPAIAFVIAGLVDTELDFWWSQAETYVNGGATPPGLGNTTAAEVVGYLKQLSNDHRLSELDRLRVASSENARVVTQLRSHELVDLERSGIVIGNHTWSHPCLNRCDPETTDREIQSAHHALEQATGHPIEWFAYPNGDWSPDAETTLTELGYRGAFLFDHRLSNMEEHLRLSRLRANSTTSLDRLSLILSGLHPALHRARGRS